MSERKIVAPTMTGVARAGRLARTKARLTLPWPQPLRESWKEAIGTTLVPGGEGRSGKARSRGRGLRGGARRLCPSALTAATALFAALTLGIAPAGASSAVEEDSQDEAGGGLDTAPGGGRQKLGAPERGGKFVPGELLVRFRSGVGPRSQASVLGVLDATTKRKLPLPGLRLVRIGAGESVPQAVAAFERRPQVRYAEPNFIYRVQATPNDPRYGELWGLNNTGQSINGVSGSADADIDAPEAWDTTTGSSAVTVAVVDTGVAYDHPDLAPNIHTNPGESGAGKESNGTDDDGNGFVDDWRGWDFIDDDNDPRDFLGHGTHVASTIGARGNDGAGIVGVNWDVGLLPVRVLNGEGFGTNASVSSGFAYAGVNGARLVNASLGGPFSQAVLDAIAGSSDTLFVVSAGNAAVDNDAFPVSIPPTYPCKYDLQNVVCVAATTHDDELAAFSNYGAKSVDLGAPGTNVLGGSPAYETVFTEDFESDIGSSWTTGGTNNTWGRTEEAASSGSFSLADSPEGNYAPETNSFARPSESIDLSGKSGCRLDYRLRMAALAWLWVEASADGTEWTTLAGWHEGWGPNFAGLSGNLSAFDGQDEVFVRFRLEVGESPAELDGVYIDDVKVKCLTSAYLGDEFRFRAGTSMAAPHVAGAAALILDREPAASPGIVKSKLVASVDALPSLSGKTVSGGRLNAAQALDATPSAPPHTTIGGPEIQVNTTTTDAQEEPAIATDSGGGFTVAWQSRGQDGSGYGVYARRFDASGEPLSGEIPVNATTQGFQGYPAIAAVPGDGFVVAWEHYPQDGSDFGIYARHFDGSGTPLSGEIPVALGSTHNRLWPVVAADGGGFTVAWSTDGQDGSEYGVYARRFDAEGTSLWSEIPVNITTANSQVLPAIATDSDGDFTVAWESLGQDGSGYGVYARRFDASGAPLSGEIPVNVTTTNGQILPTIARDPSGGFTVAWGSFLQDGEGMGVYARRFDASGEPLSGEIPVNTTTAENQSEPSIAVDPGGGFTVAWQNSDHPGGWGLGIYARRFDADGVPRSDEIPINEYPSPNELEWPVLAPGGGRGFTVAWQSGWQDGSENGVYARRFIEPPETQIDAGPAGSSSISDTTPTFEFSSSDPEASFECRVDSNPFGACSGPVATHTPPAILPDGPHTFEVRAEDSAGHTDPSPASRSFTIDTVAPDTQIDYGPPGLTNDASPVFVFSSDEGGASFECRVDGGGYSDCSSPHTTATLSDDPHKFEVRAIDEAANADASPAERSFTVDTVAPPEPSLTETAPASPANDNTPLIRGTAAEGTVRIYASGDCSEPAAGEGSAASFANPGIEASVPDDSTSSLRATATDAAGNLSGCSTDSIAYTEDSTAPAAHIDSGPAGPSNDPNASFAFSSPNGDLDHFSCSLKGSGGPVDDNPCESPRDYTALSDGGYTFSVRAIDLAGNLGPAFERHFTVDTQAPDTQIDSGPSDSTNDPTPTFSFSSDEAASFECRLDGGAYFACSSPQTTAPLADGPHSFEVRATDEAANTDPTPASRSFTVDTAPPETQIDSGPAGPTNDPNPFFAFSSEPGASFECRLDGGGYSACSSPLGTGPLPDGPHSFEVRATDEAANTDPTPASRSFTVDTAPPQTQIDSGPAGLSNDATPSFGFSSNEGASFECRFDGGGYSACSSPLGTGPLPDGPHSFEVRATDEAANTDPTPASRSFTVDATPPDTSIDSGPAGPTNDPNPSFAFSSEPGASFECQVDGGGYSACSSPLGTGPLPDGPHSFEVRATDEAANTDPTPASRSFTVDTVAPSAKLTRQGKQKASKPITVAVSCSEDCIVIATGKVLVWGSARGRAAADAARRRKARFGLSKATRRLSAGQSATLRLRPNSRKARLRLRRLVRRGRTARAAIRVRYWDRVGNWSTTKKMIRLRRG